MEHYEKRFNTLPEDDVFRKRTMGAIYYIWGLTRLALSTKDDRYDFDQYFAKMYNCLGNSPITLIRNNHTVGPWVSPVGSTRQGAMGECIEAMARSVPYIQQSYHDWMAEEDDLARGELLFYQGDIPAAELYIVKALEGAQKSKQHDITQRALFYTMRIAVLQGNSAKANQALKDMEMQLNEKLYYNRFYTYDVALGWYYYILRMPDKIPDWLKGKFTPCLDPIFLNNFGNQMKLRYHYMTKNYPVLLTYIEEQKQQVQILFGRIEQTAVEACVRYQMKDKTGAFTALGEAYHAALSNNIIMPFVELGKDMRTLITSALRTEDFGVPRPWLEKIYHKAAYYAKHQVLVISEYEKDNHINNDGKIELSKRETEVLRDLYNGLSHPEIAAEKNLSVNTVNTIYKNICNKLGVNNLAGIIRVAAEQKLV